MRLSRLSLYALLVSAPIAPLAAQSLSPYGVFVYNDFFHSYSETNGKLAVGGNATFEHWGVGQFLPASQYGDFSLVVNGNVNADEGSVFHGRTYVGGTVTATNSDFGANMQSGGTSPVNFAAESARLTAISNNYAAMSANAGTGYDLNNQLQFFGDQDFNVFTVSIEMLQAASGGYKFFSPLGATNIVNVTGSSVFSAFTNDGFYFCTDPNDQSTCQQGNNASTPEEARYTLWNFNTQTGLNVATPLHGSLMAPNADVIFGVGDIVGNVVIKSGYAEGTAQNGGAEFYANDFAGDQSFQGAITTPEPASLALFGTGLIGLAGAMRIRKRR